jgi:predicted nucleic acid-binding protein
VIVFFDTSVLIPAFLQRHVHHEASHVALAQIGHNSAVCSERSLAEFYSVVTRLPIPHRLQPEHALLCIDQFAQKIQIIALQAQEYLNEVKRAAGAKIPGNQLDDALLLACARKASPGKILTWNVARLKALAPDLANRIATP